MGRGLHGVPAHVTVLYPFVPPGQITPAVIQMAAAAVRFVPGFGCRFAGTNWFGEDILWLAPEPAGPFRALTTAARPSRSIHHSAAPSRT